MKSRIQTDMPLIGSFVSIASPAVSEIMAAVGFDFLCLDSEHGAYTAAEIESCIRAGDVAGIPVLVRVSGPGPEIGRALDSGAAGVVVPRIETAEDAVAAVAATRYPPTGSRGAGPGRATRYGIEIGRYLAEANDEVVCVVQVETKEGLANLDAIVAVPGVDVVFIGPGDLSVSLGVASGSTEHLAAIHRIREAAAARGVPSGIFTLAGDAVGEWAAHGVRFFLVSGDLAFLATSARAAASSAVSALTAVRGDAA